MTSENNNISEAVILGIDSSGLACSTALVRGDILLGEFTVDYKKTHSETLLPMIDTLLSETGIGKDELGAVACASGPGSFTGLRIGCALAKGIAAALSLPMVPVPTLMGLSYNLCGAGAFSSAVVVPLMDARRDQVYSGIYRFDGTCGIPEEVFTGGAYAVGEIIGKVNEVGASAVFLGDGVPVHEKTLKDGLSVEYGFAPPHLSRQSAGSVASLGQLLLERDGAVSADEFRPDYMRLPQAERERRQKTHKQENAQDYTYT